jgi:hypothetical protein
MVDFKIAAGFSQVIHVGVTSIRSINKENVMYHQEKIAVAPGTVKREFTSPNDSKPFGYRTLANGSFTSSLSKHLHLYIIGGNKRKYIDDNEGEELYDNKHRRYCKMLNEN